MNDEGAGVFKGNVEKNDNTVMPRVQEEKSAKITGKTDEELAVEEFEKELEPVFSGNTVDDSKDGEQSGASLERRVSMTSTGRLRENRRRRSSLAAAVFVPSQTDPTYSPDNSDGLQVFRSDTAVANEVF